MDKTINKYNSSLIYLYLVLAVITFIAFAPVIHNEFISFDDGEYIVENSHITSGLTLGNIVWAFTNGHLGNYYPLTLMSHMLDCDIYRLNPGGHHLTNLIFHICNALLLCLVLSRMTGNLWPSAFVAALFAIHPLHVESVVWASERKDMLSTFFGMLTLLVYIRYVERPAIGRYLSTLAVFALGILSKPMLVTLPFILLLLDYWPLNRLRYTPAACDINQPEQKATHCRWFIWGRLILEKIPFFALSAVQSFVTFMVHRQIGLLQPLSTYPLNWRIENALVSYIIYIRKMFWPVNLAIFYPLPKGNLPLWQIIGAVLVLILITSLAVWKLRQHPYIAVGWLWFLGTFVPVIGVVQIGIHTQSDRYTYIPYTGLFIIIAWGISDLFARLRYRKVILSLSAAVLLSALGVKTYLQAGYWHDNITLYKHATEAVKNNWWVHRFMGNAFAEQNKFDQAIVQLKEALRIDPENAMVQNDLAAAFLNKGQVDEAIRLYQKLLPLLSDNLDPNAAAQISTQGRMGVIAELYTDANINFGIALLRQGNIDEAIKHFKEALRITPDCVKAHKNLGDIFFQKDQLDEAAKHYMAVLKARPDFISEYKNLANAALQSGKLQEASRIYQMIVQLAQNDLEAYTFLGIALAQQGNLDEAVRCFNKVISIEPGSAEGYVNLGNALNLQGKPDKAIDYLTKAAQLNPNLIQAHYNLAQILIEQRRAGEAVTHLEKVIELDPSLFIPISQLASILAENKNASYYNPQRAIQLAERACKLTDYKQPEFLDILALAYAADGKYPLATETAKKALDLAQSQGQEQLKNRIQEHLHSYETKQP